MYLQHFKHPLRDNPPLTPPYQEGEIYRVVASISYDELVQHFLLLAGGGQEGIGSPHDLNCRGVARLCRFHSEAEKELRVRPQMESPR